MNLTNFIDLLEMNIAVISMMDTSTKDDTLSINDKTLQGNLYCSYRRRNPRASLVCHDKFFLN